MLSEKTTSKLFEMAGFGAPQPPSTTQTQSTDNTQTKTEDNPQTKVEDKTQTEGTENKVENKSSGNENNDGGSTDGKTSGSEEKSTEAGGKDQTDGKEESVEDILENWDTPDDSTKVDDQTPKFDHEQINKLVGGEFKSQDEFVSHYKNLQEQIQQYKKAFDEDAVPVMKEIREAVKLGIDPLEYYGLMRVDYQNIPDVDLITHHVKNTYPQLTEEQVAEYIEGLSPIDILKYGNDVRTSLSHDRDQKINALKENALKQREEKIESFKKALTEVNSLNGFSIKPHHKAELLDAFQNDRMNEILFYGKDGKPDMKKYVETALMAKYGPTMLEKVKKLTAVSAKKDMLNSVTNAKDTRKDEQPANVQQETTSTIDVALNLIRAGRK